MSECGVWGVGCESGEGMSVGVGCESGEGMSVGCGVWGVRVCGV
jgi:hypothetical protein